MQVSAQQVKQYEGDGFLVLEGFVDEEDCDRLRARAEELVQEFDPAEIVSVFSTHEQNRLTDDYFLTSGDKVRFFFEENAFHPDGTLKYEKEKSINKIGHALHDLNPVLIASPAATESESSRQPPALQIHCWSNRCTSSSNQTSAARLPVIRTARFSTPNPPRSPVCGSHSKRRRSRTAVCGPYPADIDAD